MSATEVTLEIVRGDTFIQYFRWEQELWAVAAIQSISQGASALVTLQSAPTEPPPDGWRCCIVDAKGLTQLNAEKDSLTLEPLDESLRKFRKVSSTEYELNGVSTQNFKPHTATSGFLMWHPPVSLANKSARMSIKTKATNGELLLSSLRVPTPDIVLTVDDGEKFVKAVISDILTAALTKPGVFDLEMFDTDTGGNVEKTFLGPVPLRGEITTPIT